ncbi:Esa1p-associated factor [Exophiala dermatitidis]|uniref:Chromatin modification-related protein EAF3 n=1 Tax=Exophiala dermatitidis TaxID=5970 RepID=A0AAN6ITW8_EXODE|nr:Esa1p-associated factor [Exophiala dermatitidis]KAJ4504697.1 Esa1p-associated factor [Exophiala dermatitidis]KAJ4533580.1 Esa1p-associated factor [Exophiala dermatitidis]KAJ4540324.1 Esa1p-associated factor [Exophiala dermatitidis]KAJ4559138.1 Esa1p-associated factor [Exophiala dermatitidis]
MAPHSNESKPMYQKDEKALCFHGELLYEAKVLEVRRQDAKDKTSPHEYRVHYKGWKNTWDDWVPQDRLRKLTDDNRELAANLKRELTASAPKVAPKSTGKTRRGHGSEIGSGRGSEERTSSVPAAGGRGSKRARDNEVEKEENFLTRPSIHISVPDHLKNLLVDDWENVTKSLLLVPLPSQAPANYILDDYYNEERNNRLVGSADLEILEEFVTGLKTYFDKALGKILLYRFERNQLQEVRKLWESGKYKDWEGKGPGDCYGAEHLTRMIVNLPEIVAQTNMDAESVTRLKLELSKFTTWLSRNSSRFFCAKYEKPSAEYIESAR